MSKRITISKTLHALDKLTAGAISHAAGVTIDENGDIVGYHGTERDYLLWRLNQRHQHGVDPGMAEYVGVRKTGKWEAA
jgi:hypothetical protein